MNSHTHALLIDELPHFKKIRQNFGYVHRSKSSTRAKFVKSYGYFCIVQRKQEMSMVWTKYNHSLFSLGKYTDTQLKKIILKEI